MFNHSRRMECWKCRERGLGLSWLTMGTLIRFFRHGTSAICAHLYVIYVSDQRERRLQLPSSRSNWVDGTPLIGKTRLGNAVMANRRITIGAVACLFVACTSALCWRVYHGMSGRAAPVQPQVSPETTEPKAGGDTSARIVHRSTNKVIRSTERPATSDPEILAIVEELEGRPRDLKLLSERVRQLKQINSDESTKVLERIATNGFGLNNSGLENQAATAVMDSRPESGWNLLTSKNPTVASLALNVIERAQFDADKMRLLNDCQKGARPVIRWRAAEIMAAAPAGELARAALQSITQLLAEIPNMPDRDEQFPQGLGSRLPMTVAEAGYLRLYGALTRLKLDNSELHEALSRIQGRAQYAFVLALAERGDTSVRQGLIDIVRDKNASLFRAWAVKGLGNIGTAEDLEMLRELAASDSFVLEPSSVSEVSKPVFLVREASVTAIHSISLRQKQ